MTKSAYYADVLGKTCTSAKVFDYGNKEHFLALWSEERGTPIVLNEMNGRKILIVVWDGHLPEDKQSPVQVHAHLTPMDWALAFSIKTLTLSKQGSIRPEDTPFDVRIVDLSSVIHAPESWAMWMRHQLLAEMPWVTLYAPLIGQDGDVRAGERQGLSGLSFMTIKRPAQDSS